MTLLQLVLSISLCIHTFYILQVTGTTAHAHQTPPVTSVGLIAQVFDKRILNSEIFVNIPSQHSKGHKCITVTQSSGNKRAFIAVMCLNYDMCK